MILVIGGRSKIGTALITELLNRGEQVRALVRPGEAAGGLPSDGLPADGLPADGLPADGLPAAAEAVLGDLADEGSLVTAMTGVEKVFLLSSPHPDAVGWHRNAVDAARRPQVQLLVRSSILGAGRETPAEFISAHTTCDRYLEGSGLPYAIVRPNLFLQNVPESTIPSIDATGTFYADAGQARISMVDTRDVAAVAAVALTEPGQAGAHYDVTGPEALSYADVAAKLTSAMGHRISYADASDDAVRQALPAAAVAGRPARGDRAAGIVTGAEAGPGDLIRGTDEGEGCSRITRSVLSVLCRGCGDPRGELADGGGAEGFVQVEVVVGTGWRLDTARTRSAKARASAAGAVKSFWPCTMSMGWR